ncbi:hypothetical protein [Rhodanobacter glycinis]|nr:hypothetical protein [Rhodanobacter glycinis]
MNTTRPTVLVAMFAVALGNLLVVPSAACADAGRGPARHFDLVNATLDSVIALAIAPADRDAFQDIDLGQPLQGGLSSMTFDVPAGGCLRDLRVTFHGERTQLFPHIDVCRSSGLRLTLHGGKPKHSGA